MGNDEHMDLDRKAAPPPGPFGRFYLQELINSGGMADIWLATDPDGRFARLLFDAFGVENISPHVGLVLFFILLEPASRALGVLFNAWSRRHEFEADAYAAEMTGDATPLASALKKMTSDHLAHPSPAPLRVWLDYSHPPLVERLRALAAVRVAAAEP